MIDLGLGHKAFPLFDTTGYEIGLIEEHRGHLNVVLWNEFRLIERDPLTIAPAIRCGECTVKGYILEGKWEWAA